MQFDQLKRRDFVTLLGGAVALPMAAHAQAAIPVVGYLHAASIEAAQQSLPALSKGLRETGYVEGRNVAIELRGANNDYNLLPELAAELVRRRVAVIVTGGGAVSAIAAKTATATIPIVFVMADNPIASGLVASFNRPGGNVTGITFLASELGPKRLGLLKELVPRAAHYAALINPHVPNVGSDVAELRAAALGVERDIGVFTASSTGEIDTAFALLMQRGSDALVVGSSSLFNSRRVQLATLAAYHHLPAIFYDRRATEVGGLMSYGTNILDASRQAGIYAGRILKGEKPADLPVEQPTKFEFVINLQTAKTLGISVPPTLLAQADEVIE
jgi:putative ABC transport system substrate-binding protein